LAIFPGALFLIVVTVLPDGIVGWLRQSGGDRLLTLLGNRKQVMTYPSLEEDPEVQRERENLGARD
jgi:urea transport system permease protein